MRIHFIAIGGSAMHNLAIALSALGHEVSGSDDEVYEPSKSRLNAKGLLPAKMGWDAANITADLDAVILGMHAKKDNPELLKAQDLGLKIYSYPEFLFEQSKNQTRVVIAGSHGKTTITAMILHVMHYLDRDVDYMVGAQLEGFDTMVKLTDSAEFVVLEGDEYLSSPIDLSPKFHKYNANIALISGIAWDHINVFPDEAFYKDQFRTFLSTMTNGGILVYNKEDTNLVEVVETSDAIIKKYPYQTPDYSIENGEVYVETPEGPMPLEVFGKHNMQNLSGAKQICMNMGVTEEDFFEAIMTFKGASKRLERLFESSDSVIFKDFAHAPSKVKATTNATKEQYASKSVLACLELHTYSSLNKEFIEQYNGALDAADEAIVFYDPKALEIKKMDAISPEDIKNAFGREDLKVYTNAQEFQSDLFSRKLQNQILLMMSSGNYGGLDLNQLENLL